MRRTTLILGAAAILASCNSATKQDNATTTADTASIANETSVKTDQSAKPFDINSIPVSTADIGDFPFFTLPEGLKSMNKPFEKKFDVCFFPINGVMTPFEGKLYKIFVTNEQGQEYSKRYFEKSMEDYLTSVGAVKVFDGEISKDAYDSYHKQDPNKGDDGDIGYTDEQIKYYVIRTANKGNIHVQFTSNNASGKLNVLQETAFRQTIKKVTADDIAKDLTEKGKSILYINFDNDKAKLTTDGNDVVSQISLALKNNPSLKIAIEGHTDNTGNAAHNKKLSSERALTVLNSLTAQGIKKLRLSAKGYGAEQPFAPNDTEENKAKNRRVELIKIN